MTNALTSASLFRSLVGLRGVDTTAQSWVNDLPGMSTELVADLAQPSDLFGMPQGRNSLEELPTAAVWNSVHRNAYDRLLSESLLMLSENYDYQPVIARTQEPQRTKPAETIAQSGLFVGSQLTLPYATNTSINVRGVTVFVTPNAVPNSQQIEASVRVYDVDTNALYYSEPSLFNIGVNTIPLNLSFRTLFMEPLRLAILIDVSQMYLTTLVLPDWSLCEPDTYLTEGVRTIAPNDLLNSLLPEQTYVSVDVEVTRSLDTLLARYASDLRIAYSYLCGSLLMTEKLATPNLSAFTLSNLQFTERTEGKLFDDFKRALRPAIRRLSNELQQQQALSIPTPTPNEYSINYGGSYV